MHFPLPAALIVGSIQSAMQQPIFPGKIAIWLLFMLSIVSWVMILSKALQLNRMRIADQKFGQRLRKSRTTLEVFEEAWHVEHSLQWLVYTSGARETAFQLLGSRNPGDQMQERIREAGKLNGKQHDFLQGAFESGYRQALMKLSSGVAGLRLIGVAAVMLGLIGGIWTLMIGFDGLEAGGSFGPMMGSALGFVAIALVVATPAMLARIAFSIQIERRKFELAKFRDDISRLFERKFTRLESVDHSSGFENAEPDREMEDYVEPEELAGEPDFEDESSDGGDKKKYHSIREKLLRPPAEGEGENEIAMNPIARQAATLRAKL